MENKPIVLNLPIKIVKHLRAVAKICNLSYMQVISVLIADTLLKEKKK